MRLRIVNTTLALTALLAVSPAAAQQDTARAPLDSMPRAAAFARDSARARTALPIAIAIRDTSACGAFVLEAPGVVRAFEPRKRTAARAGGLAFTPSSISSSLAGNASGGTPDTTRHPMDDLLSVVGIFAIGMVALAGERNTPARDGRDFSYGVAAAQKIWNGALVVLTATGFARGGHAAVDLVTVGRARETVDNSDGADGDVQVSVERGVFRYANSAAGDAITRAEIGDTCYVVDDQTVAKTDGAGARSAAGKIVDVEDAGVWVAIS